MKHPFDWLPADSSLVTQRNDCFGGPPAERPITPRAVQVEEEIGPLRLLAAAHEGCIILHLQRAPLSGSVVVQADVGFLHDQGDGNLTLVTGVKGYREAVASLGRIFYRAQLLHLRAGIIPRLVRYSTPLVG